jgi:peptidoglycan biosynthesis protein MviN/MurJ (putative lipid II flippase)
LACTQLSTLIILSLASLIGVGAISIFNLSYNLQSVPLSIIGVSYSIAAFPTLAKLFSCGQCKEFVLEVETSAKHIIFWSVPVIVLFIVLRAQIVRVVLGSGQFDWTDTRLTAASLALFVVSVLFQSLNLLLVRAFYAANKTAKPMIVNIGTTVLSVTFAYIFYKMFINWDTFRYFLESLLRIENTKNSAIIALPLGYSTGVIIGGLYLLITFFKEYGGTLRKIFETFFRSFCAAIIMGFGTYLSLNLLDDYFSLNSVFGVFMQGFLSGIFGIFLGVIVLWLLKSPELTEVWQTLHRKIWKVKTVPAEINEL